MKQEKMIAQKMFALLIFLIVFSFGLIWAAFVPARNEAPDEASHVNMIYFLKNHHRIPVFNHEEDLIPTQYDPQTMSKVYYSMAYISPVSYLPYVFALNGPMEDISKTNVMSARLISVLLLALAALFMYLALANIEPKNNIAATVATLFIFLIPQVIFSAGYINVEPFALLFSSLSLYFLSKIMANNLTWQNYLYFGLCLGVLGLAKPNYYIFILFVSLIILFFLKTSPKRQTIKYFFSSGAIFILINLWWWVRNIYLFGDPLILSYIKKQIVGNAPEGINSLADQGYNLLTIFSRNDFIKFTAGGFFANLGGANIFLPLIFYLIFFAIIIFSFVLAFKSYRNNRIYLWPVIITILSAVLYFAYKNLSDYSPQGRHLFPLLFPICLILYLSLSALKHLWQKIFGILIISFVFFSSLYGFWLTISRYYVTGLAYVNQSNFGSVAEGFSWHIFSTKNYQNLILYIFNGNPYLLGIPVVIITAAILFFSLVLVFWSISKTNPRADPVD